MSSRKVTAYMTGKVIISLGKSGEYLASTCDYLHVCGKSKIRFLVLLVASALLITVAPQSHGAIKSGDSCKKSGVVKISQGETFRCTKSKKSLKWKRIVKKVTPSSDSPEKKEVTEEDTFRVTDVQVSSNSPNTRGGFVVIDRIRANSTEEIVEIESFFTLDGQNRAFEGSVSLINGSLLSGQWEIVFRVPENIEPGRYLRFYLAKSAKGQVVKMTEFPLEILAPRFAVKTTCSDAAKDCPQVSDSAGTLPITQCRLTDQTIHNDGPNNGFPRPREARLGDQEARVLVMPISFKDLPFDDSTVRQLEEEFLEATEYYSTNSYGRMKLSFVVPQKEDWVLIDENWETWKARYQGDLLTITRVAVELSSKNLDLRGYDSIFFGSGKSQSVYWGGGWNGSYSTSLGPITNVYFTVGGSKINFEHNLGHTLLHLEDLYIHDTNFQTGKFSTRTPLAYDIMGGGGDYSGWSRWLSGWLDDDDVVCLDGSVSSNTVRIEFINNNDGKRLAVIPTGLGKAIFIEYRNGRKGEGSGVWIYRLDSTIAHGAGPMEGGEELLSSSNTELRTWGYEFKLVAATDSAVYVEVSRS